MKYALDACNQKSGVASHLTPPVPVRASGSNRQVEAGPPSRPLHSASLSLFLSKSPATCSGESTLSFAPLSFLLSDSTRAASMDSSLHHPSSAGCVPYDNSRQAHRSPKFITTFKVAARRPRGACISSSFHCRVRICCLSTNVHFVSV